MIKARLVLFGLSLMGMTSGPADAPEAASGIRIAIQTAAAQETGAAAPETGAETDPGGANAEDSPADDRDTEPGLADLSFMVMPEETATLEQALAEPPPEPVIEPTDPVIGEPVAPTERPRAFEPLPNLYLGALIYVSDNHWTVWVNERSVASDRPDNRFRVNEISPRGVALFWTPAGRPAGYVAVLEPNQTFDPRRGVVREGLRVAEGSSQGLPASARLR